MPRLTPSANADTTVTCRTMPTLTLLSKGCIPGALQSNANVSHVPKYPARKSFFPFFGGADKHKEIMNAVSEFKAFFGILLLLPVCPGAELGASKQSEAADAKVVICSTLFYTNVYFHTSTQGGHLASLSQRCGISCRPSCK